MDSVIRIDVLTSNVTGGASILARCQCFGTFLLALISRN